MRSWLWQAAMQRWVSLRTSQHWVHERDWQPILELQDPSFFVTFCDRVSQVEILLSLAAFLTLLDIVQSLDSGSQVLWQWQSLSAQAVRVAASRNRRFSPSKHGKLLGHWQQSCQNQDLQLLILTPLSPAQTPCRSVLFIGEASEVLMPCFLSSSHSSVPCKILI